jgi:carbon storage regulator
MLVLSRKAEQTILLDGDIAITVLSIDGDRVKLGIRAPRHVTVLRQEIFQQVQSANAGAASSAARPPLEAIASALRSR